MPSGVYKRTYKHSFNKGRKHPNRKRPISKGLTIINKVCLSCKNPFTTNCFQPRKKYCSQSCVKVSPNFTKLGKKGSEKQRDIMRSRTGDKHPNWIKDRMQLVDEHKDRGGQLHREWSREVKNRDNWKCRLIDENCNGRMESHHILPWKDHNELRYEINNGITLCHYHHPRTRTEEKRLIPYFQELLKSL